MSREPEDLQAHAVKFWPPVLTQREQDTSIIPRLIESQEKFIGILYVADASPLSWKDVLRATADMPANLFLKHLMVLSDMSGENLQRYRNEIHTLFPSGSMTYHWKEAKYQHRFLSLDVCRTWTNRALRVGGADIVLPADLSPAMEDAAMLLIHGSSSVDPGIPGFIQKKCVVGSLMGRKPNLDRFVRQRYIHVSRAIEGAATNKLGQLCQAYVRERLQNALPAWDFSRYTIPGISHNAGRTDMSFDLVATSPGGKHCAIEVSFQETTNSTIERKAGQAAARQRVLHDAGHMIAYVIDGAGNFQRNRAISTICAHSDCTVSFKDAELDKLARFLQKLK